jgi:quercetin dioxygenase-like cupin family protein
MITGHYTDVEAIPQTKYGTQKTVMRWLIGRDQDAPNFAMRLVTIQPGGFVALHEHPYEHEVFVLKGTGRVTEGDESAEVHEGDFVFVTPEVSHGF